MKIGNPKHATFLAVVALCALAFFVMRLLPNGPRLGASNAATAVAGIGRKSQVDGLPVEVLRDAFSHPKLTERYLATLPIDKQPNLQPKTRPLNPLFKPLPEAMKGLIEDQNVSVTAAGKPSENAGTGRQHDGKPKSKIELKAIMRAKTPLALVTINGKDDVTVGLGEYIDTTYRITRFSQNAVLLSSDSDETWLYVGHEVTEK